MNWQTLNTYRAQLAFTQLQMAQMLGVNINTYKGWGKRNKVPPYIAASVRAYQCLPEHQILELITNYQESTSLASIFTTTSETRDFYQQLARCLINKEVLKRENRQLLNMHANKALYLLLVSIMLDRADEKLYRKTIEPITIHSKTQQWLNRESPNNQLASDCALDGAFSVSELVKSVQTEQLQRRFCHGSI